MVCEIELEPNRWEAFLSARLPTVLDNELKCRGKERIIRDCYNKLDPMEIHRRIPLTFPMTHLVDEGGVKIECAARYPISTWQKLPSNFEFTLHTWAVLCMNIAQKEPVELQSLLAISTKIANTPLGEAVRKFQ